MENIRQTISQNIHYQILSVNYNTTKENIRNKNKTLWVNVKINTWDNVYDNINDIEIILFYPILTYNINYEKYKS